MAFACVLPVFADDELTLKLSDCPAPVKKTLELEAKGSKIENVTKLTEDDETTYSTTVVINGKTYHIRVDAEGTLNEMGLDVAEGEVKFTAAPAAVQATFRAESKGGKFDMLAKDLKYGIIVYDAVATLGGKDYSIIVAENGTLVEKVLIIAEDDIELSHCPEAVQHALKEHARGGTIGDITRSTGIGGHVFEAELEIEGKAYTIELTEGGGLISKSLVDDEE